MRILTHLIKWIVGLLLIFSGIIKTIDPIGFSIKLEEYFEVFNMPFLSSYALSLSVGITLLEVLLGVFLILGIYKKFTLWSLFLLILFFTFLTFYSAYFDVVRDCGCFGDAIKLTPWQSFSKDLVLMLLIIFLWYQQKYLDIFFNKPIGTYIALGSFLVTCCIAFLGIFHLPIVDFRPFAVGENIIDGLKNADELGLKPPHYEMKYLLKNKLNQQRIELSENQYISDKKYWQKGTSWELIETEERLVDEGYEPPIHDFVIECGDQGDMTYYYLNLPRLILIITPIPQEATTEAMNRTSLFVENAKTLDIPILSIASDNVLINDLETCLMDATTLKTMIRANPGIMILEKGTVVGKYHWRDAPAIDEIKNVFH